MIYKAVIIAIFSILLKNEKIPTDNRQQTELDKAVHSSVLDFFKNGNRIGLSIGIYDNGKKTFYNYGSVKNDSQQLPDSNTLYEIGSISKTFTGTMLAKAAADGKVSLDDDVRKYIDKKYGNYANLAFNHKIIKLKYLVSHVSGLPLFLPDNPGLFANPDYDVLPYEITRIQNAYSKDLFFRDLHTVKLDTVPGYKFRYSNAAAQLLQYTLENIYHKTYEELLGDHIAKPLGMTNTTSLLSKTNTQKRAVGYNDKGNPMPYNPSMLASAGGIFSSTTDMLRYLSFHVNEKNKTVAFSHKIVTGNIEQHATGLNWQENHLPGQPKKIWQSGGTFGFASYCVIFPGTNLAIVLLSNESDPVTQHGLEVIAEKICNHLNKTNS